MSPTLYAAQCTCIGHDVHLGDLGVQMVEPKSIRAWAKSPGRWLVKSGAVMVFMARLAFGRGSVIRHRRVIMRSMLPSTTVAGLLKAMVRMAAEE